jgi:hypothetical protein
MSDTRGSRFFSQFLIVDMQRPVLIASCSRVIGFGPAWRHRRTVLPVLPFVPVPFMSSSNFFPVVGATLVKFATGVPSESTFVVVKMNCYECTISWLTLPVAFFYCCASHPENDDE